MSRLFGPIVQLGYVLPDVEKMMADYLAAGIGPFFLMAPRPLVSYYGEERNDVVISGAFSFWNYGCNTMARDHYDANIHLVRLTLNWIQFYRLCS